MDIWDDLADERRALADLLDTLTPAQWRVQTLCPAWDVHAMAAHLVVPTEFSTVELLTTMVRARGNPDRLAQLMVSRRVGATSAELVARLRAGATSRTAPPVVGVHGPWTDALVHGEDIRVPLGLTDDRPPQRWVSALDFLVSRRGRVGFVAAPLPGVTLVATDVDWSHGHGPVVEAPAAALGLAVMRRAPRLGELRGPGAETLRAWAA